MSYASYDYYVSSYYGTTIPEADFDRCALRASDYIDYLTMGKAKTYPDTEDALKKACCAIAEQICLTADIDVTAVASETVGSHSVTYRSGADIKAGLDARMLSAAQSYLLPTGLLYRGAPCILRTL